jgi:hypothetical protein
MPISKYIGTGCAYILFVVIGLILMAWLALGITYLSEHLVITWIP